MDSIINLQITEINKEYDDTICLTVRELDNKITNFHPGQFITLLIDDNGEEVRRGFSIASSPDELPDIMLAIKKVDDGIISNYLYDQIETGDILKAIPPMGNFIVDPDPTRTWHLVMFGAGSGITPLFSQLKAILKNEPNSKVTLHYGSRNESSIIYRKEIDDLQLLYKDRFIVHHYLSKPDEGWNGLKGRIDTKKVEAYLNKEYDSIGAKVDYFLCGPDAMMSDVTKVLEERGVSGSKIHREIYHTTVVDEDEEIDLLPREVTIIFRGEEHKFLIEPEKSILQTALDAGLELPNSCQFGSCASCKAKLLAGQLQLIDQTALSEEELEHGYCLTCVGHPVTEGVIILYEDQFE